jgi:bifunctional pyridoxal-dependent enzyme with beta-cystathionase and maltose regulon repressor activities
VSVAKTARPTIRGLGRMGTLEEEGVAVLDAAAFGPSAQGFLRLSLGAGENVLADACMRIWAFAGRHLQGRARQLVA